MDFAFRGCAVQPNMRNGFPWLVLTRCDMHSIIFYQMPIGMHGAALPKYSVNNILSVCIMIRMQIYYSGVL